MNYTYSYDVQRGVTALLEIRDALDRAGPRAEALDDIADDLAATRDALQHVATAIESLVSAVDARASRRRWWRWGR